MLLDTIPGLTAFLLQKLHASGIETVEQLSNLAPEDLENISGIGSKTVEKISDALSEYYAQLPSYQDDMERLAAEHMFSKDDSSSESRSEGEGSEENVGITAGPEAVATKDAETVEEPETKAEAAVPEE